MKLYSRHRQFFKHFFLLATGAAGGVLLLFGCLYLYLSPKLPSVETLREVKLQTPLRIYSQDLKLIGEFGEKRRNPISYNEIPEQFVQAVLAAEDDSFYSHNGVDIKGLLRAAGQLVTTGSIQSGGSTITMQVARNIYLTRTQTFTRKFNEILLALQIEKALSKDEILTLYTNKIYLGNRSYGLEAAAQTYYDASASQLNLAQLAMIAGLPKAPSAYNPVANPSRALIRRNWILRRMHKLGFIDQTLLENSVSQPVTAKRHSFRNELDAPYIAEMVRRELLTMYGPKAYTEGLVAITTVDSKLQQAATQAITTNLMAYDTRHGYRGPEQQILDPEYWETALSESSVINQLFPAIVTAVEEKSVTLLIKNHGESTLPWENALSKLRLFITENRRSARIKTAAEAFSVGDLIRVTNSGGNNWKLAQLPKAQAALIAIAPNNGAIKALVGGFSFQQSHYNRVTQANRQPGSNFKPFIYATALSNGYTASSIFNDAPVVFQDKLLEKSWRPENDSGKFYGPTRLRKALYLSRNLVSIRLLNSLGIKRTLAGLSRFGFDPTSLPRDLSLALGSHAMQPIQIATGYASLANGGYKVEPHFIDRISDIKGTTVYESQPLTVCKQCDIAIDAGSQTPTNDTEHSLAGLNDLSTELGIDAAQTLPANPAPQILDPRVAFIMDSILKDVIKRGTGTRAKSLGRNDLAGKTGTTNGPRDAWFSGYQSSLVATAWLGFDQNLLLGKNEYGGSAALPIWIDFMKTALKNVPEHQATQPPGLITARIDPKTGNRVPPGTTGAIFEYYLEEQLPPLQQATSSQSGATSNAGNLPEDIF